MTHTYLLLKAYIHSPMTWLVGMFGLIFGSFTNVVIVRVPAGTFFKHQRSVCPHCQAVIPWYNNIPLLSFIVLRRRSSCCHQTISWVYPLVELTVAALFVVSYWQTPFWGHFVAAGSANLQASGRGMMLDTLALLRFMHGVTFSSFIIACSVIDFRLMIIPDRLSLPMVALGPLVALVHPELTLRSSLFGIVLGAGILYGLAWMYWLVRKEVGMGMGDVKLLAAIGGWLGYESILPTLFYGSVLGSIFGVTAMLFSGKLTLKSALPFGPFLGLGALVHFYAGGIVQEWIFLR